MESRKRKRKKRAVKTAGMLMSVCLLFTGFGVTSFAEDDQEFPIIQYVTDIFTDVSSEQWYAEYVQKAYTFEMMKGVSASEFAPETGMTRAMFVQVLYNLQGNPKPGAEGIPFKDVNREDWFYNAINWAYHHHVAEGVSSNRFAPNDFVTREQAVKLLYFFSAVKEKNEGNLYKFRDFPLVADWAVDSMLWAVSSGIISGSMDYGILYLRPRDSLKRSEASKLMSDYYTYRFGRTITVELPEETHITADQIEKGMSIPILMYHEVSGETAGPGNMYISKEKMREQLKWLKENGYETLFFSDLPHLEKYRKPVMLTFDDGYEGCYENLYPLLKEYGMKATLFVVTDTIGAANHISEAQLREMSDSGAVSIQSHTKSHFKLDGLTENELLEQYQQSKTIISSITGKSPYVLCYPEGANNELVRKLAAGYFSFGVRDRGDIWKTGGSLFYISRSGISGGYTIEDFQRIVEQ